VERRATTGGERGARVLIAIAGSNYFEPVENVPDSDRICIVVSAGMGRIDAHDRIVGIGGTGWK